MLSPPRFFFILHFFSFVSHLLVQFSGKVQQRHDEKEEEAKGLSVANRSHSLQTFELNIYF